jgi:hypothetical protein
MPLKITPSKKPLPMAKRSLLRQSSQIPTEIAPLISSDSVQSPPEVASEKEQVDHSESIGSSWQTATSRRSARTRHRVNSRTVLMYDNVINNPPPASAKLSARLVRARGQVLDQVFNEDKIATKIVAEEWVCRLKEPVSKKFWCKSFLIKRRKKCAREVL